MDIAEVTADFFEKYRLYGDLEKNVIKERFKIHYTTLEEEENLVKPVVAGAFFEGKYQIGDIVSDDFGTKYEIVGFLQENDVYSMPTQSKDLIAMDKMFITSVYIDVLDNDDIAEFIYACQITTEDRQVIEEIEDKNYEWKLLDGYFVSYSNQLKIIEKDTNEGLLLHGSFGGLLFVFSMFGISGMLVQLLQEYEYEYGVNMLCGADISDIFMRLVFQITLLMAVGLFAVFFIYGFGKIFFDIFLLAILSLGFVYGYSWKKLKTSSILSSLRSC